MSMRLACALIAAGALVAVGASGAMAHEGRHVEGFDLTVGFLNEPAYEGYLNAVFLEVTAEDTEQPQADETATSEAEADAERDEGVDAHGEIFVSTELADGETFEAVMPEDLDGMTIPYHSHLNASIAGSIEVAHDAPEADRVDVELHRDGPEPRELRVRPGTTVVWTNHTGELQLIASGPHPEEDADDHEHANGHQPVTGLESSLQVEVTHIASAQSTVMAIEPLFDRAGAYSARLIPTQPGAYRFRFFGTIKDHEIDEIFESGDNTFDSVQAQAGAQFPTTLASVRELEGVVRASQTTADEAADSAGGARAIGIVGLVIGALGLVAAAGALGLVLRARRGA